MLAVRLRKCVSSLPRGCGFVISSLTAFAPAPRLCQQHQLWPCACWMAPCQDLLSSLVASRLSSVGVARWCQQLQASHSGHGIRRHSPPLKCLELRVMSSSSGHRAQREKWFPRMLGVVTKRKRVFGQSQQTFAMISLRGELPSSLALDALPSAFCASTALRSELSQCHHWLFARPPFR